MNCLEESSLVMTLQVAIKRQPCQLTQAWQLELLLESRDNTLYIVFSVFCQYLTLRKDKVFLSLHFHPLTIIDESHYCKDWS